MLDLSLLPRKEESSKLLKWSRSKTCVVLPYPPAYSETFLKTHLQHLSAPVRLLEQFPVDVQDTDRFQLSCDKNEMLKQRLKAVLQGYVLNPIKRTNLRNFFRQHQIGVVLAEYGGTGVGVLEFCQNLRIPLVVHFHGSDAYSHENLERYGESYKRMFAYANALIAVSRDMIGQLVRLGASREKIFYNPCGVEVSQFKPASRKHSLQVIAVGRFVEKKAPYLTILAFKKLLEHVPEAKLVMVGSGPLHDVCRQLIKSLHIDHAVELKGVLEPEHVAALMEQSCIFVQHSLTPRSGDSEGTPVAILEAAASALPIVGTRHAGIMDAVVEGETGYLVDEGDVEGMAQHMYQLLTDPQLADKMGSRGREYITENFNVNASIKNLKDILDQYRR